MNLRTDYFGLPLSDDIIFDTKLVSHKMQNLKRGKAADVFGLSAEHLLFSHPVLSVILSKLFQLIWLTGYIPECFKYNYIVPIPKPKDCHSKTMTYDDFRGIAISPIISKIFEYCFFNCFQSLLATNDNQFGIQKGVGCRHALQNSGRGQPPRT